MLLALVTVTNYTFHEWVLSDSFAYVATSWVLVSLVFFLNSLFTFLKIYKLKEDIEEGGFFASLPDFYDLTSHALVYTAFIIRTTNQSESENSKSIMAVATLMLWGQALHFLRPFPTTGPLVRMIFAILNAIRELMLILVFVIFGFSQSFYLLAYKDFNLDFGDPYKGFINGKAPSSFFYHIL